MRIPVISLDEELKVDPTLATVPVVLPPPYRNPDWPQPGGYASNAMYHLAAPGRLRQVWDADAGKGSDIDSHIISSPVVAAGMVFTLDSEAHVFAFRTADGTPVWNRELAPNNGVDYPTLWGLLGKHNNIDPTKGMGGGVAYDDGKLFVTSGFGVVICLDAKTGKDIWRHELNMPIINAPVVNGGRLFVSTHDNHFYALAETDGRQLWDHHGHHRIRRHPGNHQRRGGGRKRDRALYLRRNLSRCASRTAGRLERHADPFAAMSPRCRSWTISRAAR